MSGDRVPFLTLERATSSDWNEIQSLRERTLNDALRYAFGESFYDYGAPALHSDRPLVLGGLVATASGSDAIVSAGAIATAGSGVAVGALDSAYQMAFLRAPATVAAPTPASDAHYVLEASVLDVATASRAVQIYNPTTETFAPVTADKRIERQVTLRFREGTLSGPPSPVAGWVPIAVMFRTTAGGAIGANLWDCRKLARMTRPESLLGSDAPSRVREQRVDVNSPGANTAFLCLNGIDMRGNELFAYSLGSQDISALPKTGAFVADTWYHLYLTAGEDGAFPVTGYNANIKHRGVLCITDVEPYLGKNVSTLTLDAGPLRSVPDEEAVYVGSVRRNSGNSGWLSTFTSGSRVMLGQGLTMAQVVSLASANTVVTTLAPSFAKQRILVEWSNGGTGGNASINIIQGATTIRSIRADFGTAGHTIVEIPAGNFTVNVNTTFATGIDMEVSLLGFSY